MLSTARRKRSIHTPSPNRTSRSGVCNPGRQSPRRLLHPRARILSYHYERNPADPRVTHALTLEVDDFGNVLKSAAIGYGRRRPDPALSSEDQAKQTEVRITWTENGFTNRIDLDDAYRTPLPSESRTYELTGLRSRPAERRFVFDEI